MDKNYNLAIIDQLNVDTSQTEEKFRHLANEVLIFTIRALQDLNRLEQEIAERSEALKKPNHPNELQPGELELWAEYERRHQEIITQICVKPSNGGSQSFGIPTKYDYLNDANTSLSLIIKSANRAILETAYGTGTKRKEQFALKNDGAGWKIDTKKYGYAEEDTWSKDDL